MTAPNTKCSVCNTNCYKRPSEISKSKSGKVYCSKICYGVDNRSAIRICPICNESELKHRTSKTCSRKCSNRSRLGAVYLGVEGLYVSHAGLTTQIYYTYTML